jgi:4-amino-4-deoxy-L-arabinose transferase-like glycosyltransferase
MSSSAPQPRRPLGFELALVVVVALAILAPSIWRYALVDPWETHYGEVGRRMLQDHDWVHTNWSQDEGFRSKPVLTFWMMAASMRVLGVGVDGGYSGEMVASEWTMFALRLPFVLAGVLGLALLWWVLARRANRRVAWLALLVVGTTPFYDLVTRQAITDIAPVACLLGAFATFVMSIEDGDTPIVTLGYVGLPGRARRPRRPVTALHLLLLGGLVTIALQAVYYAYYFALSPQLAANVRFPLPAVVLPGLMLLAFGVVVVGALHGWTVGPPGQAADRLFGVRPFRTMRPVYLLWFYGFLGISVLGKGPTIVAIAAIAAAFYVLLGHRWRALYEGAFELKLGLIVLLVICLPWHLAMYLKDGARFIQEYVVTHLLNRAAVGVDNETGTFDYYVAQLGLGMWPWIGLLPPALAALVVGTDTHPAGVGVRLHVALWSIAGFGFFAAVPTKFHHYILPVVPLLGIAIAFLLDDLLARRARLHPLFAALGVAIVLLVTRDLMFEPEKWIEMFVFRYDRPWPGMEPWAIDPSDGLLALGLCAAAAIALFATRYLRTAVVAVGAAALAVALWAMHVYMPVAGTHWGMREAMRSYYEQRTIYGQTLVYFGAGELADDWADVTDTWRFETFVPDGLQVGQPMTIRIELHKATDERITDQSYAVVGEVRAIGDHDVTVAIPAAERHKLDEPVAAGRGGPRGRRPVRVVDADRLIAWQLYWRGENFWSGDEIWGWLPEHKSAFIKTDNADFLKYLGDRTLVPLGRRVFVITEAGRAASLRGLLPTPRGRDSFTTVDTTSNKFTMVSFVM